MNAAADTFVLLQISDTHIGAEWDRPETPDECVERALAAIGALRRRPDALVVSGDLTQNGAPAEYARLRELLAPLGLEPHVLPGNHDLRGPLREAFGLPGEGAEPASHVVGLGPLRLVCLDSTVPGGEGGALDEGRLDWLEGALAADRETPTVIAMHHPPLLADMPSFEAIGLAPEARAGLAEVVGRHPQVARIVAGHVHRVMVAELAGRPVLTIPSTYMQTILDLDEARIDMAADPPGFALHVLRAGVLTSHVQTFRGS
jgi:3',5'-cyclic-AMP phosphodiesterase